MLPASVESLAIEVGRREGGREARSLGRDLGA